MEKKEYEYAGLLYEELEEMRKLILKDEEINGKNSLTARCGGFCTIICC